MPKFVITALLVEVVSEEKQIVDLKYDWSGEERAKSIETAYNQFPLLLAPSSNGARRMVITDSKPYVEPTIPEEMAECAKELLAKSPAKKEDTADEDP